MHMTRSASLGTAPARGSVLVPFAGRFWSARTRQTDGYTSHPSIPQMFWRKIPRPQLAVSLPALEFRDFYSRRSENVGCSCHTHAGLTGPRLQHAARPPPAPLPNPRRRDGNLLRKKFLALRGPGASKFEHF